MSFRERLPRNPGLRIDQSNGSFTDEAIAIDRGLGNDTLLGGSGADFLFGGPGNDFVDGNLGSDLALLGEDDDRFHWDSGEGSDTVEGQDGSDTLDFSGKHQREHRRVRERPADPVLPRHPTSRWT